MLLLVLLVFFVFPLVSAVQAGAAFTCRGRDKAQINTKTVSELVSHPAHGTSQFTIEF